MIAFGKTKDMKMAPIEAWKLNFEPLTFQFVIGSGQNVQPPGITDGKLALTAKGSQTQSP